MHQKSVPVICEQEYCQGVFIYPRTLCVTEPVNLFIVEATVMTGKTATFEITTVCKQWTLHNQNITTKEILLFHMIAISVCI